MRPTRSSGDPIRPSGTVEAASAGVGLGSEFAIRLTPQADPAAQPVASSRGQDAVSAAAARRVLVVDDNRDAADSLAIFLQTVGHIVHVSYDGESALKAADELEPDVAIIDLGMPRMNGYEVCRRIRKTGWGKRALLIAQTGWGQDEDKRRSREAGFDHHLTKPPEPDVVQRLIAACADPPDEPLR